MIEGMRPETHRTFMAAWMKCSERDGAEDVCGRILSMCFRVVERQGPEIDWGSALKKKEGEFVSGRGCEDREGEGRGGRLTGVQHRFVKFG